MVHSGSFLWHGHCSEAVPGSVRHPCFCRMRVHTWSRIFAGCADLGSRGLQWLQREVWKRFKQEKKNHRNKLPRMSFTSSHLDSCLFPNTFSTLKTWVNTWAASLWPSNINWSALVCDHTDFWFDFSCIYALFFLCIWRLYRYMVISWREHHRKEEIQPQPPFMFEQILEICNRIRAASRPQETALTPCWGVGVGSVSRPRCFSLIIK